MQIPLILDPSTDQSLTSQLVGQLRAAITRGRIARGTKLPSSRRLSEQLGVSRNTVVRAYEELCSEGYVEARPASCVAVVACLPDSMAVPTDAAPGLHHHDGDESVEMPMPALQPRCQDLVNRSRNRLSFDFFPGRPNAGLFPIKTWRRLLQNCLSHGGAVGLSQYGDPAGSIALRTAIAGHLAVTRGIVAEASRIMGVDRIPEGINIAARPFLGPGTVAVVENPGYQGAVFGLAAAAAEIISVPVDNHGLTVAGLPSRRAALAYVTPSHQYPTGRTLAAPRRERLNAWARRNGCYLVEDDYDCDFRYEGSALQAIAAMAPDCTIYLGTFSKALGAGLRLGYMVVPAQLADATRAAKTLHNNDNPWLDQAVLGDMMRSGSYAAHLSRMRPQYRERRDCLLAALHRYFGLVEVSGEDGGLHIFWQLPPDFPDAATVEALARRVRVGVYALANAGAHDARHHLVAARTGPRLCGADAEADRGRHRAARRGSGAGDPAPDQRAACRAALSRRRTRPGARARKSGSPQSSAAGSTRKAATSGNVETIFESAEWHRHARSHQHLPLSDQGPECAALVEHISRRRPAVSVGPDVRAGAAQYADLYASAEMGQERHVRDALAQQGACRPAYAARPRHHAVHHHPGQPADPRRQPRRRKRLRQGRGIFPSPGPDLARGAAASALPRGAFHGQARQRNLADQSRDREKPWRAMGLRNQSTTLPSQFLHRRCPALGGVRVDRQQSANGRGDVPG